MVTFEEVLKAHDLPAEGVAQQTGRPDFLNTYSSKVLAILLDSNSNIAGVWTNRKTPGYPFAEIIGKSVFIGGNIRSDDLTPNDTLERELNEEVRKKVIRPSRETTKFVSEYLMAIPGEQIGGSFNLAYYIDFSAVFKTYFHIDETLDHLEVAGLRGATTEQKIKALSREISKHANEAAQIIIPIKELEHGTYTAGFGFGDGHKLRQILSEEGITVGMKLPDLKVVRFPLEEPFLASTPYVDKPYLLQYLRTDNNPLKKKITGNEAFRPRE